MPSAAVLAGITDALRLTADERDHIHTLAGQAPPAASGGDGDIDPGLEYVLRAVEETVPASITDDLSNVAAQNWLNLELFGEFNIASAPELNAFAIAVAACPLLALLLSVELLNRALKRHRFQAATFHSSRILP